MMLPKQDPIALPAWKALNETVDLSKTLTQFFTEESDRSYLRHLWNDFYIDFSKNHIDRSILDLLIRLAEESGLKAAIENMFSGV